MILEVCAANLPSALAAQHAGAHRIELCTGLELGGLTPSLGLVRTAVQSLDIPVHVLIRPREGGFCYSDIEKDAIFRDIDLCFMCGVAGIVIGATNARGELDWGLMAAFKKAARGMDITCHRVIDFAPDPLDALECLIELKYDRVLSSGQAATANEGRVLLKKMVESAQNRIAVMPGGGINEHNIAELAKFTGASEFHFSAKKKAGFGSPALPGLELWHWESDEGAIRDTIAALNI
jgi:copper homeostasis protein